MWGGTPLFCNAEAPAPLVAWAENSCNPHPLKKSVVSEFMVSEVSGNLGPLDGKEQNSCFPLKSLVMFMYNPSQCCGSQASGVNLGTGYLPSCTLPFLLEVINHVSVTVSSTLEDRSRSMPLNKHNSLSKRINLSLTSLSCVGTGPTTKCCKIGSKSKNLWYFGLDAFHNLFEEVSSGSYLSC